MSSLLRSIAALVGITCALFAIPAAAGAEDCPIVDGVITVTQCRDPRDAVALPDDGLVDTSAIQYAIDKVHAAGGGGVFFPAGSYDAAGLIHRSRVRLFGPDGAQPTAKIKRISSNDHDLISGEINETHGTISAGSNKLVVRDPKGFDVGDQVAIRGAETPSPNQRSTLSSPLLPGTGQAVFVNNGFGFSEHGGFLRVGDEILEVAPSSRGASMMVTTSRARYASVQPWAHPTGTTVAQVRVLYATVTAINGPNIMLDKTAKTTVWLAPISVGAANVTVEDLELDGSRPSPSMLPASPLNYMLANKVLVKDNIIRNAHHGGVHLQRGTHSSTVENNTFMDIGDLTSGMGADIWVFQAARDNTIRNNRFINSVPMAGGSVSGIFLDDRTINSTEWDGDVHHNLIENNRVDLHDVAQKDVTAIGVSGGSYNIIRGNRINIGSGTTSAMGIRLITDIQQAPNAVVSQYNTVSNNELAGLTTSAIWLNRANRNTISGNSIRDSYANCMDNGTGNTFTNNTTDDQPCVGAASSSGSSSQGDALNQLLKPLF